METACEVLHLFGVVPAAVEPLGNRGGFSGASLWRCETALGLLCLRAWPPAVAPQQLLFIHHLQSMAVEAGLRFVPRVLDCPTGGTFLEHRQRLWDLTAWMPGQADFHAQPSRARLQAACEALARLHLVWTAVSPARGVCPAVKRRLETLRLWNECASSLGPIGSLLSQAHRLIQRWIGSVPVLLAPWQSLSQVLQPCLCDIWHDHVLFEGDTVSGVIDYGECKTDHVAADLARLLGSLIEDDEESWTAGLTAYRRVRPLSETEEALAHILDRTGTILGAANWLRWLVYEGRRFDDPAAAERRLAVLVARMERW